MVRAISGLFSLWLSCHTQQHIAETVGMTAETASSFLQKIQKTDSCRKSEKSAISHEADFEPQK